jgi:single-strand DNA-binding protein
MASLNKVMLIGNLTRDAELRYIPSGSAVLEFRLAVSRKYKKPDGQEVEETCFVDVNLWGKRGEAVSQYLTKGKPLFVEGRLQLDEWDDKESGQKRSKLRVVAENIEFLGGRNDGQGGGRSFESNGAPASASGAPNGGGQKNGYSGGQRPNGNGGGNGGQPYARPASAPGGSTSAAMQLSEDDIPF